MIALADKISKSFGGRVLYSNATLQLNAGERWALVGPNGAGKTTLLKIIMGLESADEGTVTFAKDATLGYLEQETELMGDRTALNEVIESAHEIKQWERKVNDLSIKIAETPEGATLNKYLEDYAHAMERFERLGGYELESRARQILAGLGFPVEDFDKQLKSFRAAGRCVFLCQSCSFVVLTFFFWMSLPTTWTWNLFSGLRGSYRHMMERFCW